MTALCERCGNYTDICGCAEAEALAARLAEAERRIEAAIVWDDGQDKVLLAILNGTRRPTVSADVARDLVKRVLPCGCQYFGERVDFVCPYHPSTAVTVNASTNDKGIST